MSTSSSHPSFWRRVPLAFGAFFSTLSDAAYAARVEKLSLPEAAPVAPVAPTPAPAAAPVILKEATPDAALQLLALLQREARLIDFTQENLGSHADADIGAAARVVHEGCAKVMREYFTIEAVRQEAEGSRIVLQEGFDSAQVRLTGNVVGSAPFTGTLSHRGWRASSVRLPKLSEQHDAAILAPAEVEL
ncbi:hypothetical protein CSQ92_11260 [Janthinobacterium sp. BJB446]|uniref:DUF2760 domain-containing protein n=1 Tax=Janthinobacterium sp. BJB446 TaxID=2048009 RepID=UPI000C102280|nr:DUF2760 domain-containing protein [Janthinobacterium sp. BJB446]PHV23512.1 hypothetical protein CSQ92_11260 [Janthinobacterium sp. BJB446]